MYPATASIGVSQAAVIEHDFTSTAAAAPMSARIDGWGEY